LAKGLNNDPSFIDEDNDRTNVLPFLSAILLFRYRSITKGSVSLTELLLMIKPLKLFKSQLNGESYFGMLRPD